MGLVFAEIDRYPMVKLSVLACSGLEKQEENLGTWKEMLYLSRW